jgi:hypothetical protein
LRRCSPLDLLIGSTVALALMLTVVGLEMTALVMYWCAALFWHVMNIRKCGYVTIPLYAIFSLLYHTFALVDAILLLLSIAFAELLATVQFALSFCWAGYHAAAQWHQYFRRTAHAIRVAFRAPWKRPKRRGFNSGGVCCDADADGNNHHNDDDDQDATGRPVHVEEEGHRRPRPYRQPRQQLQQQEEQHRYVVLQDSFDDECSSRHARQQPTPTTAIQTAHVYHTT